MESTKASQPKPSPEYSAFVELAAKLIAVPREELEEKKSDYKRVKKKTKRNRPVHK